MTGLVRVLAKIFIRKELLTLMLLRFKSSSFNLDSSPLSDVFSANTYLSLCLSYHFPKKMSERMGILNFDENSFKISL